MNAEPKTEFMWLILTHLDELGTHETGLLDEYQFDPHRKWRFDYAIPHLKLGFEYEGFGKGHLNWKSYSKDCEKYSTAAIAGWCVIRITALMIQDGRAGKLIRNAIDEKVKVLT